jgi:hypothetical protein
MIGEDKESVAIGVSKRATRRRRVGRRLAVARAVSIAALAWFCGGAVAEPSSNSDSGDTQSSKESSSARLPQITVEAQRREIEKRVREEIEKRVREFVSHVPVLSNSDESFARWNTPICPMVAGLTRDDGEFVLTRLSEIAGSVGAPLAPRQCRANFIVFVTPDPVGSLKVWAARAGYQHLFGDAYPRNIQAFLQARRAIRVWYNERQVAAENGSVLTPGSSSNGLVMSGAGAVGTATVHSFNANRLEWNAVWTLSSVIEVVDAGAVKGLTFGQMADYIAMAGLAKFNLDADFGSAISILRLFKGTDEPKASSLSDWDKAYLKALYHARQSSRLQPDLIRESMLRDLTLDLSVAQSVN